MLLVDIYFHEVFSLYISYIEKDDRVCGLPSPYISIEKVPSAQGHGNGVYDDIPHTKIHTLYLAIFFQIVNIESFYLAKVL